jgi:glycine/D-amino acid oxidase-like deaminating enzyme
VTPFDRRRFLKAAGAGVGSLAADAKRLLAGQRTGPNPNAEIIVVGAGAFGGWTALYLREMGFSVTLIDHVWLVGGGSGHGYKHGIMLGEYVANRVVGGDKHPEQNDIFKLKERSF